MHCAFIGIGSNLGKRVKNCNNAVEQISKISNIVKLSSLYESEPVGVENQPKFINAVIKINTMLSPFNLLDSLKLIEKKIGRKKTVRWGPRVIDLDILFYDDLILNDEKLVIPHPRLHERIFVLKPLVEIESGFEHPTINLTVDELVSDLNYSNNLVKIGEFLHK
ncbi:MAG: 2-amino-4-hydroxy-6-hydroxymethyldihydropteridine diphosphokinase [Candidatus Dadabacteria bacterium]|nr:2-amino-4-hydroxy-6-hydroxymethyldihydropteridine diphosphokinase [Candidatus Dadabacteria bacterium]NIQ15260.1 2-amino-4-hydroxy-6-hydroxymethyldihydropteridine diphosphokinase [Candidatus Dadabacteria bacterium]